MQKIPVYVISLARAPERRAAISEHLEKIGIEFEVLEAVDGLKIPEADLSLYACPEAGLTRGTIGCGISHCRAYEKLLLDGHETALILEDDARIHKDIKICLQSGIDSSEFDICLLDCLNRSSRVPVFYDKSDVLQLPAGFQAFALSSGPQTLHAYFVSRSGAQARIHNLLPLREAVDLYFHCLAPLKFYAIVGRAAAWVSPLSLTSSTSRTGFIESRPRLGPLRKKYWFRELVDWLKLRRPIQYGLLYLMVAEGFLPRGRRWSPLPTGRPVIFD
jgi:glycosyl transferase family 25